MNTRGNQMLVVARKVSAAEGSPLAVHCAWTLAKMLGINDLGDFNPHGLSTVDDCLQEAEALGYRDGAQDAVPVWFVGTPLAESWDSGAQARCEAGQAGTQEEWDAMSQEDQEESSNSFHEMCERGVGDNHRFYDLLMSRWLVGYCGH